ncbi:hypothetical protein PAAG_11193 [Paracoccidioides lutzii Pb01]|uniref:Uncharacterized protein n=1 Tax=Paracoccidioides lutzii (strain ATCC MYA-826 / Pb01) TaxID=502779 RepID=A0A0A2V3E9_PARBA|nr:hypothetical protein PAAG_11193 [Paracoccidioides lutzii Pb01]KGQ02018.1 hypothetical protein PAAG_11193 [Paracoccidioides lutzii Pb01]
MDAYFSSVTGDVEEECRVAGDGDGLSSCCLSWTLEACPDKDSALSRNPRELELIARPSRDLERESATVAIQSQDQKAPIDQLLRMDPEQSDSSTAPPVMSCGQFYHSLGRLLVKTVFLLQQ